VGPGGELVQPDPLDEVGPGVDDGDVQVAAQPQVVGRIDARIAAADDDDAGGNGVMSSHAL
jgi:hypothetical protein